MESSIIFVLYIFVILLYCCCPDDDQINNSNRSSTTNRNIVICEHSVDFLKVFEQFSRFFLYLFTAHSTRLTIALMNKLRIHKRRQQNIGREKEQECWHFNARTLWTLLNIFLSWYMRLPEDAYSIGTLHFFPHFKSVFFAYDFCCV